MYVIILILILLSLSVILFCYTSNNNFKEGATGNSDQIQINENTANIKVLQNDMKDLIKLRKVITGLTNSIQTSETTLTNLNQKLDEQSKEYDEQVNNIRDGVTDDDE
tara:strand:- start:3062 stop:3385 length:324 start_codon:yes stop_codon:yes gene_type:complete